MYIERKITKMIYGTVREEVRGRIRQNKEIKAKSSGKI